MSILIPYCFLGSFLATVFALQWWIEPSYPLMVWIAVMIIGITSIIIPRIIGRGVACYAPTACITGIIVALLSVSHSADRGQFADLALLNHAKNPVIKGTVTGQPDDRGTKIEYVLTTQSVLLTKTGSWIAMHARVMVTDRSQAPMPAPGDTLEVHGRRIPVDAGSGYERYLKMHDIGAAIESRYADATGVEGQMWARAFWNVKTGFQRQLRLMLPEPASGLLDGLLTGTNGGLTQTVQNDFRRTGLSHIVAVSGSNITVVLSVLSGLLFFLPLKWRFLPCAIGIVCFTVFVGASASVVRAAITGIIGLVALQSENKNDARLATLWTAFFMLCWNPWQLWADAGFQLSFLAVVGLIELTPFIEPWLKRVPETGGMREALTATLAAQFTAVPWGIALFGAVPLISPLSNVLVAPFIPMAMLTGAVGLLIAFIMPPLTAVVGLPASLLLNTIIEAAHLLAAIPYASVSVPAFSSWLMALYYITLAASVVVLRARSTTGTTTHQPPSPSSAP